MTFSEKSNHIFWNATQDYHKRDDVDAPMVNPYPEKTIEYDLYLKNWIDAVQWHLEDIVRDPEIDPVKALAIKRRIDKSNQDRTDLVERIDSYFLQQYADVKPLPDARHQHRESGLGHRSPFDTGFEDIPHAAGGGTERGFARTH